MSDFTLTIKGSLEDDPTEAGRTASTLEQGLVVNARALIASLPPGSVAEASFSGDTEGDVDLTPVPAPVQPIELAGFASGMRSLASQLDAAAASSGTPDPELSDDASALRTMADKLAAQESAPVDTSPPVVGTLPDGTIPVPEPVLTQPTREDGSVVPTPAAGAGPAATAPLGDSPAGTEPPSVPLAPVDPVAAVAAFVPKLVGETYPDYTGRVAAWNADPANVAAPITALDEATWTAAPVG